MASRSPVFIVATANKFASLPPELTRAGRFDARFFFGCPGPAGRRRILDIHLQARGLAPDTFDTEALVDATHGFTGAEIEQSILDTLYTAFAEGKAPSGEMLLQRVQTTTPLIKAVGKGLDELWEMVKQGRAELASDDMLTRSQVAKLIDPHLFRPCYCRLEAIDGFLEQKSLGERLLMGAVFGGPSAAVLESGDSEWVYVHTNVRFDLADQHPFKFLERPETMATNGILDTLVAQYGIETIIFETETLKRRFEAHDELSTYAELFSLAVA